MKKGIYCYKDCEDLMEITHTGKFLIEWTTDGKKHYAMTIVRAELFINQYTYIGEV